MEFHNFPLKIPVAMQSKSAHLITPSISFHHKVRPEDVLYILRYSDQLDDQQHRFSQISRLWNLDGSASCKSLVTFYQLDHSLVGS